jgi:mono/diheme cytochrome c family protein
MTTRTTRSWPLTIQPLVFASLVTIASGLLERGELSAADPPVPTESANGAREAARVNAAANSPAEVAPAEVAAAGASEPTLRAEFTERVLPFVRTYCRDCHGSERQEAKLDLSPFDSFDTVISGHATWEVVLERLQAGEMPPEGAARRPPTAATAAVVNWIRAVRRFQASQNAGDPGSVPARRLSNAEYNYAVRDLTGVDIRPTQAFPVDPANEAGFDNSAESLTMSPALLNKYLDAARQVSDHLLFKPHGFDFAPHPVVTDTDRDKYAVKRIVEFYQRQPTDYAAYFFAAWRYKFRPAAADPIASDSASDSAATLAALAAKEGVSARYLTAIWAMLEEANESVGPIGKLQRMWRALPQDATQLETARVGCGQMRDFVVQLREKLTWTFPNLEEAGVHKGSQSFVLWKNRAYAAHRRRCNQAVLIVSESVTTTTDADSGDDLRIPAEPTAQAEYRAAFDRFCTLFPDAFYIAERGRDYLGVPKEKQEKGRLLSAGFHSMMGYFRDDQPLYDLVLDEPAQRQLDELWRELDFITSAPLRQFTGFIWFERTDSPFMRGAEFDFARAEDKDVTSEQKINQLAEVYLTKVRTQGGKGVAVQAIEDYFRNINQQIRAVEKARRNAEPSHLVALLDFARRAYRRPLSELEQQELTEFYQSLRDKSGLSHEEAMQDSLVAILMSPHFLYRIDLAEPREGIHPLSDDDLASRLSFFLWSSIPDQRLLDRAAAGDLHQPAVLLAETRRMLQDERVRGLAVEFAGNWLDFRRFETHNSVDRGRFPAFTDELRQAMFEEPIRFFEDLIRNNRPVNGLLDADYTFVNATLAAHYGMDELTFAPGQWKRVDDAGRYQRGGLLPMSIFLTANSPGLRTSPVKRGYWVVRRLLGERIPPPPPNVPELPADESQLELSLRETLARHRNHKSCAGCHNRFDSIGLVFENFGPIGTLREKDLAGRAVETQATFPDGTEGAGVQDLQRYLQQQRQADFIDNLSRKLLTYALGRSLLLSDESLIQNMQARLATDDHRFQSLVEPIVLSPQFLSKRGRDPQVKE